MTFDDEPTADERAAFEAMTQLERARLVPCCSEVERRGVENGGPGCTCWTPVYAEPQRPPVPGIPVARRAPCRTCACHVAAGQLSDGSELPAGLEEAYAWLVARAARGEAFYCHEGARVPIRWEHPTEPPRAPADHYVDDAGHSDWPPPMVDGVPYRADGRPAELCFAWDRLRRAT